MKNHLPYSRIPYRSVFMLMGFLFFIPFSSFSQKTEVDSSDIDKEDLNQKIENIAEQTDAELDYTDLLEELNYYLKHPINLNNTNAEELQKLIVLNDIQINNLFDHIAKNGKLISLYELQSINGFDTETINKILPYIYVSENVKSRHFSFKEMLNNSSNSLMIRYQQVLEEQKGFSPITDSALNVSPNSRYLGSPEKIFVKYRFTYYNNISFGVTAEKDAGEEFSKGSQKNGFDFYSAHYYMKDFGVVKALAIGDYQVQFGQGLTLWTGLGFGKSSDGTGIKKNAAGIKPYTSVTENMFMRGVGTTIGTKDIELSFFFSSKKIDANITSMDSLSSEVLYISSLQQTGLHSTPNEVADKDAIGETTFGGHLCYKTKKLNIGTTVFKSEYSANLQRQLQPYNQFQFNGKENTNIGIDYSYIYKNFNIFGEVSQSENNARAFLTGILMSLDQKVSLSVLYRNYDKKYQALYSSAFGESSTPANEKGIYFGMFLKPLRAFTINAYIDNISFPWLRYRIDAPSKEIDYLLQVNWKPSKKLEMYIRYRQTNKAINNSDPDDMIDLTSGTLKQNYRYNASFKVSPSFTLKNRIELMRYKIGNGTTQKGYIIYQDVSYKKMKSPYSFSLRYAIFDAETYDSRIYTYESDVLYAYSIPAFYYKGTRFYITTRYTINRNIDVWLRFAQTYYSNRNVIGSGLTEINGHTKSEVKVQLRLRF
ncbi:MAG: helix-hairpin-helix domain-containing protein [Bacteroidales bacterium]